MKRPLKCPYCEQIGVIRMERVEAPGGNQLFITGIDGRFVRTGSVNAQGQPMIRCDICNTAFAIERRAAERPSPRGGGPKPDENS